VTELSRYVFEVLRKDKEFILYRGRSKNDGSQAAFASYGAPSILGEADARQEPRRSVPRSRVLVLSTAAEYPAANSLKRLRHECSLREELDAAWAARPIATTRYWDRVVLVFEDPGGVPLAQLVGREQPLDLAFSLRLAISVSIAISQMHQRGIIHKDIKPANILVDSATCQSWLTGFGIASRLPRERQSPEPPEIIAGTLAYMAPEQSGRMNRSIDSRSDLYSLGVTLYEVLTGALPFTASDPMEWVHCHIARQPVPPAQRLISVPLIVSAIVMKLLAKTSEERYQTAVGVERDLRHCLAQWEARGHIEDFLLGEYDTPDRLLIPEKLYGRAHEVETLLAAFDRIVKSGAAELVLVSGYSGIGKSSVVNELHKALVPPRGLFAAGKFDQYKRDIPYSTLAQAFQNLVQPLLSKSETELRGWRDALLEAVGPNGRLMIDIAPELKIIIGEQPAVPELPPQDAQRRFQLVFRRFIDVFASPEHPLALFLDDLQWLDAATLDLLEDLLTHPDVNYLLLIGAYRDNEVTVAHPLMQKLAAIRTAGGKVAEITLGPLGREHVGQLVADALRCESELALPLAELVHGKTGGNPFFAIQFISSLAEERMLIFDHDSSRWFWDLDLIHAKGYTDNVVDLMVGRLTRLPAETEQALQQLACLGNVADLATLSIVLGTEEEQVHAALWPSVRQELVDRLGGAYRFVHDRVQEAAYSRISEELRGRAHLRIGRLLAARTCREKRDEAIFDIVNQLNRGAALMTSAEERVQLAELNLTAGKRAKASSAFASALNYLAAGAALLPADAWEHHYELIFELELHRAECEFLTGGTAAEERLSKLSERAHNLVDVASVASLQEVLYTTLDRLDLSVEVGLDYLRKVGINWTAHPTKEEVVREYEETLARLENCPIERMVELPRMSNPESRATVEVLTELVPAAYFTDLELCSLVVCRIANVSLERGNCNGSVYAYSLLGFLLRTRFGNHAAGFSFGRLALKLSDETDLGRFRARVYLNFAYCVNPWTRHIRTGRSLLRRGLTGAYETGDLTFAAYLYYCLITDLLASGDPLDDVQREAEIGLEFASRTRFGLVVDILTGHLRLIRALRNLTDELGSFNDRAFDEQLFEKHLEKDPRLANPTCVYWIRKLQACYFAGDYDAAVAAATKAEPLLWTSPASFEIADYHFYAGLARAGVLDTTPVSERQPHLEALAAHHRQLQIWAGNCPENFENRGALVGAEIARIEGHALDAMDLYEQAIRSARVNDFVHNEALAYERAAYFYAGRGFEKFARTYLREARYCYLRWGADGKVRQLDEFYPDLRQEERVPGPTSTIGASVEHLDFAALIKASQALSGEIVLEKLIDALMRTAIEHAGAQRGLLILLRGAEPWIEAEATTSGDAIGVHLRSAPATEAAVPESIVHYVLRTQEGVMLDDASAQNPFSSDSYIRRLKARSILSLPLIHQAKLIGVLYLENNLTPHVFTPTRIAILKVLASQAAISLENTRLYRDLEEREAKIRRLVEANIIGIFIWNIEGQIIEANEAFLRMVQYTREDLASGRVRWRDLTPAEWREGDEKAVAELKATRSARPLEKEYFRKDGSRVPVLIGAAMFEESGNEGVAFVLDLGRQKRSEEALKRAQAELAHVTRVLTVGELTASIAHEISQPLAAIVTNGNAGLRWLNGDSPNLEETSQAIRRVIRDGQRAGEVVSRIRALFKKAPQVQEPLAINEVIDEVLALTQSEVNSNQVSLRTQFASDLPLIRGDRVQLQQAILNFILNAIQAMSGIADGPRELVILSEEASFSEIGSKPQNNQENASASTECADVLITVRDSGIGFDPQHVDRLFSAFYTTKPQGLGIGLTISRSIIEAHGGRLWAKANVPRGAVFQFTLPVDGQGNIKIKNDE
jgi:PAS domain S-box-containing protein